GGGDEASGRGGDCRGTAEEEDPPRLPRRPWAQEETRDHAGRRRRKPGGDSSGLAGGGLASGHRESCPREEEVPPRLARRSRPQEARARGGGRDRRGRVRS